MPQPEGNRCLYEKRFGMTRLEAVKNIFLFACYTGLAYVDISCLTKSTLLEKMTERIGLLPIAGKQAPVHPYHYYHRRKRF
jgi:hypothetical protein